VAALSVAALSILLIVEAAGTAQRIGNDDARHTLSGALAELAKQYRDRVGADANWYALPPEAQDLSLRAVARIVCQAYPDVQGGYTAGAPELDYPAAARRAIAGLLADARSSGSASRVSADAHDLYVSEALRLGPSDPIAWAQKRLPGRNDPWLRQRQALLAALALAGLVSVGGVIATVVRLHQGIREIQRGLRALEEDFAYSLPQRNDELGEISGSINRMAAVRRSLEAEVAREQRLRSIGRLAAGVAHEIRNPLNSIRLCMEMFERRLDRHCLRREDLQMVCGEVDRLNHLLTGLLTFDNRKQPRRVREAVLPVVQQCLDLLQPQASERGVALEMKNPDGEVAALFDVLNLKQAVMNLVLNAIQASRQGGSVHVAISKAGGAVRVTVRDEGPGLTAEQQERLFEVFYTTKANGTGLGLAVSRELVAGMGGALRYEDGRPGARFLIDLPVENGSNG
jgi:signal transduction histidine kinase